MGVSEKKALNRFLIILCEFSIDLLTITAGAIIAVTIVTNDKLYVWMSAGFLVLSLPFRYWKLGVKKIGDE